MLEAAGFPVAVEPRDQAHRSDRPQARLGTSNIGPVRPVKQACAAAVRVLRYEPNQEARSGLRES